jgi:hypothetical protein
LLPLFSNYNSLIRPHLITMKKTLLILLILIGFLSCKSHNNSKSVWTETYEGKLYKQLDNGFKTRFRDAEKRHKLVSYTVKRLKVDLPNGLESVSIDSLNNLCIKIGTDYGFADNDLNGKDEVPHATAWTPELEKMIRTDLLRLTQMEDMQNTYKFCDCAITKLKKMYPDSIFFPLQKDISFKVGEKCRTELLGDGK